MLGIQERRKAEGSREAGQPEQGRGPLCVASGNEAPAQKERVPLVITEFKIMR